MCTENQVFVDIDDPKYGGPQFIAKLYTEGLGRMPDPQGYRHYMEVIEQKLCSAQTLLEITTEFVNSDEFKALQLTPAEAAIAIYRAVMNRDPYLYEFDMCRAFLAEHPVEEYLPKLFFCAEFEAMLPQIIRGPYHFGHAQYDYQLSGRFYTVDDILEMFETTDEVVLEPGDVVLCHRPLEMPKGKTLRTRGGEGNYYLRQARIVRTQAFSKGVICLDDDAKVIGLWIDGNKKAYDYLANHPKLRPGRAVDIGVYGTNTLIRGCKLSDAVCGTTLEVYTTRGTTIQNNLITCYGSSHMAGKWCDGITVHGTGSLVENNGVVDATDVSVVIFLYRDEETLAPQNSIVRNNTFINVGNSAFGGINADGWLDGTHDWDFTGTEFTDNIFWTSYKAHQHICLSFATFAWMAARGNYCVNCKMTGNRTPEGLSVCCGAGIAVDGQKNCLVRDNKIDICLGPWTNPDAGMGEPQVICVHETSTGDIQGPYTRAPMHVGNAGFIHGPWHEPFEKITLRKARTY